MEGRQAAWTGGSGRARGTRDTATGREVKECAPGHRPQYSDAALATRRLFGGVAGVRRRAGAPAAPPRRAQARADRGAAAELGDLDEAAAVDGLRHARRERQRTRHLRRVVTAGDADDRHGAEGAPPQ